MRLDVFELVDRIEELRPDEGLIRTSGLVPRSGQIFEGHFPGYPILPGVILIEFMAQTAGWLVLSRVGFRQLAVLAAVREAKLRGSVAPGTRLLAEARIEHAGSGYSVATARVSNNGQAVADAGLTIRLLPVPNAEFERALHERARALGLSV
jgi:3-hydroxyacyl-[acyl-carrier-protein] dehydratase